MTERERAFRCREEGREEGILMVARNLLDVLDDEAIAVKTGLSPERVAALRKG